MKKTRKLFISLFLLLTMCVTLTGLCAVEAQAAAKSVKNIKYSSYLTAKIKKYAATVKKGSTKLKVKEEGFVKFNVPATKTYTFTFSKQTRSGGTDSYNNGYAYIMLPQKDRYSSKVFLNSQKFSTQGGKTTSAYFCNSETGKEKTTGSFLAKRTCRLKLKKGQTVYLFMHFLYAGSINLTIK